MALEIVELGDVAFPASAGNAASLAEQAEYNELIEAAAGTMGKAYAVSVPDGESQRGVSNRISRAAKRCGYNIAAYSGIHNGKDVVSFKVVSLMTPAQLAKRDADAAKAKKAGRKPKV